MADKLKFTAGGKTAKLPPDCTLAELREKFSRLLKCELDAVELTYQDSDEEIEIVDDGDLDDAKAKVSEGRVALGLVGSAVVTPVVGGGSGSPAPTKPHPTKAKRDAAVAASEALGAALGRPAGFDFWGFLTHNWAPDELGRSNHDRVAKVFQNLRAQGMKNWFDEEEMGGNVVSQMTSGIDRSSVVLVFITKLYLEKTAGAAARGENDNCFLEFDYASRKKDKQKMICVVMEPCCLDTSSWSGAVGMHLGGRIHIDCTSDDPAKFAQVCEEIRQEILKVATGTAPKPKVGGGAARVVDDTSDEEGEFARTPTRQQLEELQKIQEARDMEDAEKASLDAMQTFYHGTSVDAGIAIQNGGFRVDLSGTNACTMLGDGVYLTTTLGKAMSYTSEPPAGRSPAGSRPHGGCVLTLKVDLGKTKELKDHDPMMCTWHRNGFDSAHSGDGVNGQMEEHCVRDVSRVTVVDVVLGNTGAANRAGYSVRGGTLSFNAQMIQKVQLVFKAGDLRKAATAGDGDKVDALLAAGVDANSAAEVDANGFTPLHCAAQHGHSKVCAALVAAGANLEATLPKSGETALLMAVNNKANKDNEDAKLATAQVLIAHGANVNAHQNPPNEELTVLKVALSFKFSTIVAALRDVSEGRARHLTWFVSPAFASSSGSLTALALGIPRSGGSRIPSREKHPGAGFAFGVKTGSSDEKGPAAIISGAAAAAIDVPIAAGETSVDTLDVSFELTPLAGMLGQTAVEPQSPIRTASAQIEPPTPELKGRPAKTLSREFTGIPMMGSPALGKISIDTPARTLKIPNETLQQMIAYCKSGDACVFNFLSSLAAETACAALRSKDAKGFTALHRAAQYGRWELIAGLVKFGADVEERTIRRDDESDVGWTLRDDGWTPLLRAAVPYTMQLDEATKMATVQQLLHCGARIRSIIEQDGMGLNKIAQLWTEPAEPGGAIPTARSPLAGESVVNCLKCAVEIDTPAAVNASSPWTKIIHVTTSQTLHVLYALGDATSQSTDHTHVQPPGGISRIVQVDEDTYARYWSYVLNPRLPDSDDDL